MGQLTGKADIYIDGAWINTSQEGSSLDGIAGVENTIIMNSRGKKGGHTSKAVPCVVKANVLVTADFDITLYTVDGMSVVFAADNGFSYLIADATFLKAETLDANKGMVAISYGGDAENVSA